MSSKSGYQKRKEKADKEQHVNKLPKISGFFKPCETSSTSNNEASGNGIDIVIVQGPGENKNKLNSKNSNTDEDTDVLHKDHDNDKDDNVASMNIVADSDTDHTLTTPGATNADDNQLHNDTFNHSERNNLSTDPAFWTNVEILRENLTEWKIIPQNLDCGFSASIREQYGRKRLVNITLFQRSMLNGESHNRNWLVYSPSKGFIVCAVCKGFSKIKTALTEGFEDWSNAARRIAEHENSDSHRSAFTDYLARKSSYSRIDKQLIEEIKKEKEYWKELLKRVIAVCSFLSTRTLPFRGQVEKLGRSDNGLFLGTLELIAQFDPFLSQHLSNKGDCGKGSVSYLSKTIYEEITSQLCVEVQNIIIHRIRQATYFSIIIDSTPDCVHTDQLTLVIRYCQYGPQESFLCFIPLKERHSGQYLADIVVSQLNQFKIAILNCVGQGYDNASNLSGQYNGVQTRIKQLAPHAEYIPCSAHSLNLVCQHAASLSVQCISFFGVIQKLYNFFSSSTFRWSILLKVLRLGDKCKTLKSLSNTRWCARYEAVSSLASSYSQVLDCLINMSEDPEMNAQTQIEAADYLKQLVTLEIALLCQIWNKFLERINVTSKKLQAVDLPIKEAEHLLISLKEFILSQRNVECFEHYKNISTSIDGVNNEFKCQRIKKHKRLHDEGHDSDPHLDAESNFRINVYYVLIDGIANELNRRCTIYSSTKDKFSWIWDSDASVSKFIDTYSLHIEIDIFADEVKQYHFYRKSILKDKNTFLDEDNLSPDIYVYRHLVNQARSMFPNVEIGMRIYFTLPITNAGGERSFSKLKLIKNYLRSKLSDEKLSSLAILSIEPEILKLVNVNDLIETFASKKARKVSL